MTTPWVSVSNVDIDGDSGQVVVGATVNGDQLLDAPFTGVPDLPADCADLVRETALLDPGSASAAAQLTLPTLNDGSTLTLNVRAVRTGNGAALDATAAPSWSGAAFGNSAFIGIGGTPVLYTDTDGAGSNMGYDFSPALIGALTVN